MPPPLASSRRALRSDGTSQPGSTGRDARLAALRARGRAAHPDLPVDDHGFTAHVARFGSALLDGADAVEAGDLLLAYAALAGVPAAVQRLRRACWPAVVRYLGPLATSKTFMDELGQDLWEALLVGGANAAPRLAAYSGRGPLAGFVGITARRLALSGLRRHQAQARAAARGLAGSPSVTRDVELGLIKRRYSRLFEQAIEQAFAILDEREREILRLHVADGLTVDRIAKRHGVSQSTVSRWLAGARKRVLAEGRRLLRQRVPVSESEFDSLAKLLASQIELSLSQVAPRRPP